MSLCPVRCFTCGKVIQRIYTRFLNLCAEGVDPKDAMRQLGLTRYCCMGVVMDTVDFYEMLSNYQDTHAPKENAYIKYKTKQTVKREYVAR